MKKLLLILVVLFAVNAYSQQTAQYVWKGTNLGTTWLHLAKDTSKTYLKTLQFEILNDDADGDTIWVALEDDTLAANIFPLLAGETVFYPSTYISGLRIKSSDSAPYRVKLY